jgi:hypothetical protein
VRAANQKPMIVGLQRCVEFPASRRHRVPSSNRGSPVCSILDAR